MRKLASVFLLLILSGACGGDEDGVGDFLGVGMRQLTTTGGSSPSWSPAGDQIVYANMQDLWVISPEGGDPVRVSSLPGTENAPVWHLDQSRKEIVFVNNPNPDTFVLYTLDLDGGEPELILSTSANISSPSFTFPDDRIAYVSNKRREGIYLVGSGGGAPVQLNNSDNWDLVVAARCSPVEATIAYVENRSSNFNILKLPLSGGQPVALTSYSSTVGDVNKLLYLDWSRDGGEIVFTHSANPYSTTSAVFTMTSSGGNLKAWTEDPLDQIVDYRTPSYSPEGNRLVCEHLGELWILQLR